MIPKKSQHDLFTYYKQTHPEKPVDDCTTYVAGRGYAPPVMELYERQEIRSYSLGIGMMILFFLLVTGIAYNFIFGIVSALGRAFLSHIPSAYTYPVYGQLVSSLSYALTMLIGMEIYSYYIKMPYSKAFPMRRPNGKILAASIPISMMVVVVGSFLSAGISVFISMFGFLPVSPEFTPPNYGYALPFFFINTAVVPAVFEEMMFRGIIMQSLRRFGDSFALLTSSILFGLVHGNLVQAPMAFLSGLIIGYFVLRTGSLLTGMAIHFVNNTLAMLLGAATEPLSHNLQTAIIYMAFAFYIAAGLLALAWLLRYDGNIFSLHPSGTLLSLGHKLRYFFTTFWMLALMLVLMVIASEYFIVLY